MERLRSHFTYANVMSSIAVFLAVTGGTAAIAISGKNQVKKDDIAKGAVRSDDIAKNAVGTSDVAVDSLGAADLAPGSVGTSETASVPVARIERTADLPVGIVSEKVLFDTETSTKGEFYDPLDMWKPTAPDVVTFPVAGLYRVTAHVSWAFDDTETPGGFGDQGSREIILAGTLNQISAVRMSGEQTIHEATALINAPGGNGIGVNVAQSNEDDSTINATEVTLEVIWLAPRP